MGAIMRICCGRNLGNGMKRRTRPQGRVLSILPILFPLVALCHNLILDAVYQIVDKRDGLIA